MLNSSLYKQFRVVFIVITIFAMIAAGPAFIITAQSTGSGSAINLSGSLRMMSYKLTLAVTNPYSTPEERQLATYAALEEFGERLQSKGLLQGIPNDEKDRIAMMYQTVKENFFKQIQPLAKRAVADPQERRNFMKEVQSFVKDVDQFVTLLEERLSFRLLLLKVFLSATLIGALVVTYMMLRIVRLKVFGPLKDLETAVDAVRRGNFEVRLKHLSNDEIGRLGRGFNFMVSQLERLYGSLEEEVERKTYDLDHRNKGLQYLAQASERLLGQSSLQNSLEEILEGALPYLEATSMAVHANVLGELPQQKAQDADQYCLAKTSNWQDVITPEVKKTILHAQSGGQVGVLLVQFKDSSLSGAQESFLSMFNGLIARAIISKLRSQDDQRLAVLEERSTIARELHDSIAQTLSYTKIQIVRLKRGLAGVADSALQEVLKELENGVSTAYSQLREVLTAFRLQGHRTSFIDALNDIVETFQQRLGIQVEVHNTLISEQLTPNDQVHLTHILKESLANIEKHAQATHVLVNLHCTKQGGFLMEVQDNGIGVQKNPEKPNHFGLSIMKERAQSMGATLEVKAAPGSGTLVRVIKETTGNKEEQRL